MLVLISMTLFSQFSIYGGIAPYRMDAKEASNTGVFIGMSINHVYFDFSGNFASGEGEYLDFISSYTYDANKIQINNINIGYVFYISKLSFTPLIGLASYKDIFIDPILFTTYTYGETQYAGNASALIGLQIGDNLLFNFGMGTFEKLKFGIGYKFDY